MNKEYQIYMGFSGKNTTKVYVSYDFQKLTAIQKDPYYPTGTNVFGFHVIENTEENKQWLLMEKLKGRTEAILEIITLDLDKFSLHYF